MRSTNDEPPCERLTAARAAGSVATSDFDAWAQSLRPENVRNTDRGDDTKGYGAT
jgi:hypothetical protein